MVLIAGTAGGIGYASVAGWPGMAVVFVVWHFFVFCNLVRLRRALELIWVGTFLVTASLAIFGIMGWPHALLACLAATVVLVVQALRDPMYHGIAWSRVNPDLPQRWRDVGA